MRNVFRCVFLLVVTIGMLNAGVISTTGEVPGTTVNAIDLTGFSTTGAAMVGMVVTATFGGGNVSCVWAATGPVSGGCAGSAVGIGSFTVAESGDTFTSDWTLTNTTPVGAAGIALLSVLFQGAPGLTVFDRTFGGVFGTDGSALGADATGTTPAGQPNGSATYINLVATLGNPPVGDIFTDLRIDFGNGLAQQAPAVWVSDTDTIGLRGGVPEPGTFGPLALGGLLVAAGRLRRRK